MPPLPPSRRRWMQRIAVLGLSGLGMPVWAQATRATAVPLHVLLIGNGRYQHNAALRNPPRDVQLLAQAFTARGAHVSTLLDQTSQQMQSAIKSFLQALQNKPAALWIGYSGHAVQIEGRNYLQGIDSDFTTAQRVRGQGLNMEALVRLVEGSQPSAAVIAIDACRNNPFEPERTRGMTQGLAPLDPMGLCISFSTAPYMRALDGDDGQYSPYAQALAKALAGQASKSLDQVLRETADSVFARTRRKQIPEYRSALRAEWWFGSKDITLRHAAAADTQAAVQNTAAREVSYRPDEPAPAPRYMQMPPAQWTRLEMQLMSRQRSLSGAQARQLVQPLPPSASVEERLLAAMVLQDGHASTAAQPERARALLQPLADQGHVLAQNLMGESFFAEREYDQAYKWLSLAARSGYSRARTNLGQMQMMGHAGNDPMAGALQTLGGMLQQGREQQMPAPGQMPSPQFQEQLQQLMQQFKR